MCLNAFLWCFPWLLIGARVAGNLQLIMSILRTRLFLWFSLLLLVAVPLGTVGDVCSHFSYNAGSFNGGSFTGGVQLLIPSWTFNCEGTVNNWFAHVNGNTSIVDGSGIEFQVLKPDPVKSNVYSLTYHNLYRYPGSSSNGSKIEIQVNSFQTRLPVRPGYIVGVYIDPNATNELSLLYEETEEDIDIYYWENLTERMCDLSLCDAKVMRGVRPLVGWKFQDLLGQVSHLETVIEALKQDNQYCDESEVSCVLPTVKPTVSTTLIPSSSLLVSSSDTVSSSLFMTTTSSSTLTTPPSSPLLDSTSSTPSLSHSPLIPLPPSSSVMPSVTPSSSPTEGGGGGGGFLDNLSIQVVAVLGVIVILVLLVIILSLIICICCLCRSKTSIEVSAAHSIENPDYYNGTMSVKRNDELTSSTSMPLPSIPVTMTTHNTYLEGSLRDSNVVADTHFMSSQSEAPGGRRKGGGEEKVDSKSWQHSSQPVPLSNGLPNNDYDDPEPSHSALSPQSHNGYTHYYSSPPPPGGEASPLLPPAGGPYYSLPTDSSPGIYDMPDTSSKVVPSSEDPEVMDSYDKIIIKDSSPPGESVPTGGDPFIYAYVPTSQQRLLNWRYEIPADQEYDKLNFFVQTQTFWKPAATTTGLYEQLASNKYREINRKEIVVSKTLGEGQFGYVSKGMWAHANERHEVAVKMLKPDATDQDRLKLLQEAAIMGQFSHKNIVKLHGVVTVGEPVMMLLEFMPRGELKAYLRSIRSKLNNRNVMANLPKLLLRFCRDIASGMSYLSEKSFVHRDLAARNVLLTSDLTCKIGDFGMARDLMEDESNYYKSSGGIIPLKWTAPEALNFKKYTSASDVWSYGMVLHEIWSLGHKPFNDLSNPIVIALVNSKHCQAPPPGCSRAVYQLMVQCWNPEHSLRPKFSRISEYLRESDETLLRWSREDLAVGKEVSQLGARLEVSTDLYVDLQRTYQAAMLEQSSRNSS